VTGLLAATFEPPSTKDFVFGCRFSLSIGSLDLCFNFIILLLTLTTLFVLAFFYFGLRKPKVVPGKWQLLTELGIGFVRENIATPMLGHEAAGFMPLLATFFFFILVGNMFEVFPGISFSANSRVAIPLVLAMVSWFTYNGVGIKRHGFFGYLRNTCIIKAAPWWIRYPLLMPIEFISNIIVRPITLTVRLWANFLAGHFLLAIFFLGAWFFFQTGGIAYLPGIFSYGLGIVLVAFEIFVAALQAFIFAVLSASYIGQAMAEEH